MSTGLVKGRRTVIVLLLFFPFCFFVSCFLASCSSPSNHWEFDMVKGSSSAYHSGRITFSPWDSVPQVGLELARGTYGQRFYVHLYKRTFSPYRRDSTKALVVFMIDGERYPFVGHRMEGGQTLLLKSEDADVLVQALQEKKIVTIRVAGYKGEVLSDSFAENFELLQEISIRGE